MRVNELKRLLPDLRAVLLMVPAFVAMLIVDAPVAATYLYYTCVVVFLVGLSHWMRKLVAPYFDFREFLAVAKEQPLPAAIVVASFVALTITFVTTVVQWVMK